MKSVFSVLMVIVFVNFGQSQNKKNTKTLKFSDYKLEYPKTWKKKNFYGYILLNRLENGESLNRDVQIRVFPNHLKEVYDNRKIKECLLEHANVLSPHEMNKSYLISSNNIEGNFMCRIDYELSLDKEENKYKMVEFVRLENRSLKYYGYMAKAELFDKYYDEAISIINSIQKR